MSNNRSTRLAVVLRLADQLVQEVVDRLQQQQGIIRKEKQQLQQLCQYSDEYIRKLSTHTQGLRAQDFIDSRIFLQRLVTLQTSQRTKIKQLDIAVSQLISAWQERYHRRNLISDLIEKLKDAEDQALEDQLQKEIDELSSQKFFQKHSGL